MSRQTPRSPLRADSTFLKPVRSVSSSPVQHHSAGAQHPQRCPGIGERSATADLSIHPGETWRALDLGTLFPSGFAPWKRFFTHSSSLTFSTPTRRLSFQFSDRDGRPSSDSSRNRNPTEKWTTAQVRSHNFSMFVTVTQDSPKMPT